MLVRRTGAKRGGSPTWFVSADREEEREAMRIGLLEEQAPLESSWKYVLAWGFGSREEAQAEMEEMAEEVGEAVAMVRGEAPVDGIARLLAALPVSDEDWDRIRAEPYG